MSLVVTKTDSISFTVSVTGATNVSFRTSSSSASLSVPSISAIAVTTKTPKKVIVSV